MNNEQTIRLEQLVQPEMTGQRLDHCLVELFPEYSRSQLQQWIKSAAVKIDNKICTKQKQKVIEGQRICIEATITANENWQAQNIPVDIVFEDDHIIIINKPANLVVHPGAGNPDGTLINALLYHDPTLAQLPRAGIIHRLDKDTSGLLIVSKSLEAHHQLTKAMKERAIKREYIAIVKGLPLTGGTIDAAIGRHPTQRIKMSVQPQGRPALTHYRIVERFRAHTLIRVQLQTGRTHQIRVHMNHIHYPILGDPIYGRNWTIPHKLNQEVKDALKGFKRQALHALHLKFQHPIHEDQQLEFNADIAEDIQALLNVLRKDSKDLN